MKKERRFRCLSDSFCYYKKGAIYVLGDGHENVPQTTLKNSPKSWQEVFEDNEQEESIGNRLIKLGELMNKREELTHTVDETDDSIDELLTEMKTFFNNFK